MSRAPNAVTTMLVVAAMIVASPRASRAQQQTPDPRMLLNLDLFTAQSGKADASGSHDSMFEQLRTLRAMGYLNGNRQVSPAASPASTTNGPSSDRDNGTPSNTLDLGGRQ